MYSLFSDFTNNCELPQNVPFWACVFRSVAAGTLNLVAVFQYIDQRRLVSTKSIRGHARPKSTLNRKWTHPSPSFSSLTMSTTQDPAISAALVDWVSAPPQESSAEHALGKHVQPTAETQTHLLPYRIIRWPRHIPYPKWYRPEVFRRFGRQG